MVLRICLHLGLTADPFTRFLHDGLKVPCRCINSMVRYDLPRKPSNLLYWEVFVTDSDMDFHLVKQMSRAKRSQIHEICQAEDLAASVLGPRPLYGRGF